MEVRDGHVVQLKGSDGNSSCSSSCSTFQELDNCNPKVDSSENDNSEEPLVAEPISVALGAGRYWR
jgi:hypothetical protein